jgi:hypothetical protein
VKLFCELFFTLSSLTAPLYPQIWRRWHPPMS